jgi:hypothetical protein
MLLALAAVTLGVSCRDSTGIRQGGRVSILLTDAPGDFQSVVVTVERIYLQVGETEHAERVELLVEPVTVDLLALQNVALALVDGKAVPGGTYPQLRLVLSGGYLEVVEEVDLEGNATRTRIHASSPAYAAAQGVTAAGGLTMPSHAESGLKIQLPGGAVAVDGEEQMLLLDFSVAESFGHAAGQSGTWVMNPVIRATDFRQTGAVELALAPGTGVTLPEGVALADFAVALDRNGDEIVVPFVPFNGEFRARLNLLEAGVAYPVALRAPAGLSVSLAPAFPAAVQATAGTLTRFNFTITATTPG